MHEPPTARTETVRDTYFGVTIADPYRWMETETAEFDSWLDGQDAYARDVLEALPGRAEILARLRSLRADQGVRRLGVTLAGGYVFALREDPGKAVPVLVASGTGAAERVLLDPNTMRDPDGAAHHAVDWYVPSPDGRYVACGISMGGSERSVLRVVEVPTGDLLPDAIDGAWLRFVSWLDDGESLLYHRFRGTDRRDSRSLRHRLGTDPATDLVLLARGLNERLPLSPVDRPLLYRPPGSAWTVAIVSHSGLSGSVTSDLGDCTLYVAPTECLDEPADCPWRLVAAREDGVTAFALGPDTVYLVSHRDAPRRRVLAVPAAGGPSRVAVPEGERVVTAVDVVHGHLFVREHDGGVARLRRAPLDGTRTAPGGGEPVEVPLPIDGAITEWTELPDPPGLRIVLDSWTSPMRTYRYHIGTGEFSAGGSRAGHEDVVAYRVFAPARDGTPIPISLVHRRDLAYDGGNPVWLAGYGAYGITLVPGYEPHRAVWLEHGGIWAVAHLRGGGEYGRAWHEAGRLSTKENTVTDFIDCAEHLVARGYTRPGLLVGVGGSAGGIPTGGALVRRPDLWGAMVISVPVVNSLRFEFSENGPINMGDLGSLRTEDGFRSLLMSDAYHRVHDGTAYPPVLLTAGRNDSRVPAWQPGKFAARLQAAAPDGLTLLRVDSDAGHGFGSTADQRDIEFADQFAFALAAVEGKLTGRPRGPA